MSQKEPLIIGIDTCILFNALEDNQIRRTLNHLKNTNHEIVIPLTVAGELVMQGIQEGKFDQFYKIIELLKEIDATFLIPNPILRDCCFCIDKYLEKNGRSSTTDRTHLAYSIAHDCDYYLTTKSETRTLGIPKECDRKIKIMDIDKIKTAIIKK